MMFDPASKNALWTPNTVFGSFCINADDHKGDPAKSFLKSSSIVVP